MRRFNTTHITGLFVLAMSCLILAGTNPAMGQRMGGGGGGMGGGGGGMGGGGGGGGGMGGDGSLLTTFVTDDFSGSGVCAMCHGGLTDTTGADVSIDTHWQPTMMANSAKDPLWQAKIESEINRSPALRTVIEDKCSRCHTPMARVQAITDGNSVAVLAPGFFDPAHTLHEAAMDGVSCTLCHQIQNTGLGQPATFTGNYVIDTSTSSPYRLIFGQFSDPFANPMQMHSGYTPVYGAHTGDSALCGSCHTLYTPIVDAGGNVVGEFPEQMTYLEWQHSDYGDGVGIDQRCQDCHMPVAAGAAKISNRPMMLSARSPFSQHQFTGGNVFMLNLLMNNLSDLGVTATAANFADTLARTISQLQSQTAALSLANLQATADILTVALNVENMAGHKLPSGIPLRRVWIHLKVTDKRGQTVFESGAPQADGSIAGNDADQNAAAYESHYDLITSPGQVQIYEDVMHDTDGAITYTFLRAAGYLKDNRLLPAGFDKSTAGDHIAVYGAAATDDNFVAGADQITYQVDVSGRRRPLYVTARLLYQNVPYRFTADLFQDGTPLVQSFRSRYNAADKTPSVLATAQLVVR